MKPYKVKKNDLRDGVLLSHKDWLSNEHWMCKRSRLVNIYREDDSRSDNLEQLINALPKENLANYYKTEIVIDSFGLQCRLFRSDCGKKLLLSERYVEAFDLGVVHGNDEDNLVIGGIMNGGESEFVLMKCRDADYKKLVNLLS